MYRCTCTYMYAINIIGPHEDTVHTESTTSCDYSYSTVLSMFHIQLQLHIFLGCKELRESTCVHQGTMLPQKHIQKNIISDFDIAAEHLV